MIESRVSDTAKKHTDSADPPSEPHRASHATNTTQTRRYRLPLASFLTPRNEGDGTLRTTSMRRSARSWLPIFTIGLVPSVGKAGHVALPKATGLTESRRGTLVVHALLPHDRDAPTKDLIGRDAPAVHSFHERPSIRCRGPSTSGPDLSTSLNNIHPSNTSSTPCFTHDVVAQPSIVAPGTSSARCPSSRRWKNGRCCPRSPGLTPTVETGTRPRTGARGCCLVLPMTWSSTSRVSQSRTRPVAIRSIALPARTRLT
jgi:hypothetical protein